VNLLVEYFDMVNRVVTAGAGYPYTRTRRIMELEGMLERAAREHESGHATHKDVLRALHDLEAAWLYEVARAQREAGRRAPP